MDREAIFPIIFALFAVALTAFKWLSARTTTDKIQAWQRAAEKLGGTFSEHSESSARKGLAIEGDIKGTRVWALLVERHNGNSRTLCTEVHATSSSQNLRLCVYRRLRLAPTGSGLAGVKPFVTGDADFDGAYVVRASDETLARSWLDATARARIMATEGYAFVIEDCGVRGIVEGTESDDVRLVNAAEAVAALARGGLHLLDTIREVGTSLCGETTQQVSSGAIGGFEISLQLPGATVIFDLVHRETGTHLFKALTWTRIRLETLGKHAPFVAVHREAPKDALEVEGLETFSVDDEALNASHRFEGADPSATSERLDAALCQRLVAVGPTLLADDGAEVTVVLAGVDHDHERLAASVEIVLVLAERRDGPYR